MHRAHENEPPAAEEPPPVLGSWRAIYSVVLAGLVFMIAVCGAIAWWGSR